MSQWNIGRDGTDLRVKVSTHGYYEVWRPTGEPDAYGGYRLEEVEVLKRGGIEDLTDGDIVHDAHGGISSLNGEEVTYELLEPYALVAIDAVIIEAEGALKRKEAQVNTIEEVQALYAAGTFGEHDIYVGGDGDRYAVVDGEVREVQHSPEFTALWDRVWDEYVGEDESVENYRRAFDALGAEVDKLTPEERRRVLAWVNVETGSNT